MAWLRFFVALGERRGSDPPALPAANGQHEGLAAIPWKSPAASSPHHKESPSWSREAYAKSLAGATCSSPLRRPWTVSVSWTRSEGAFVCGGGICHGYRRDASTSDRLSRHKVISKTINGLSVYHYIRWNLEKVGHKAPVGRGPAARAPGSYGAGQ